MTHNEYACPFCKQNEKSMRELILHILVLELLRTGPIMEDGLKLRRTCFCGAKFEFDMAREGEKAIMKLKEHITGRKLPGISSDNITIEEIHSWLCYTNWLMGKKS